MKNNINRQFVTIDNQGNTIYAYPFNVICDVMAGKLLPDADCFREGIAKTVDAIFHRALCGEYYAIIGELYRKGIGIEQFAENWGMSAEEARSLHAKILRMLRHPKRKDLFRSLFDDCWAPGEEDIEDYEEDPDDDDMRPSIEPIDETTEDAKATFVTRWEQHRFLEYVHRCVQNPSFRELWDEMSLPTKERRAMLGECFADIFSDVPDAESKLRETASSQYFNIRFKVINALDFVPASRAVFFLERYGLWDGQAKNLNEIATIYHCTREFVRQEMEPAIEQAKRVCHSYILADKDDEV